MKRCYFDHNATTPVASEVVDAMVDQLRASFGNPSSVHREGQVARQALETARRRVAHSIGANQSEIIFTSGGTESNNLALLGLVRSAALTPKHLITTMVEHPSVLEACRQLQREGVEVTFLPVDSNGLVDPDDVRRSLRRETCLVSVIHANNETGTIQPIAAIAEIVNAARTAGQPVYFHSDGVQAPGRIPVSVRDLGVDLYSMSGHKVYAPKGIGALYVRKDVGLQPLQFGGRQERARRPGTENTPAAVAFATALAVLNEPDILQLLRDNFEAKLLDGLDNISITAKEVPRLPNTSNVYFEAIDGGALVIALDLKGFAVSSGSACSSGSVEPSHVLLAMGRSAAEARSCLRFSFGRGNTLDEANDLADAVIASVHNLRVARKNRVSFQKGEYVPV
jgi:cysteine desulfurase